jgi:Na+/H+-dicarboxylate symporter
MTIDKRKLTIQILLGMAAGICAGVVINLLGKPAWAQAWLVDGAFEVGGKIFLRLLTVLVVPLVFVSLVCGAAALDDIRKVGRVGAKTFGLYLLTTVVAIALAIAAALIVQPGAGFPTNGVRDFAAPELPAFKDTLINIFPSNIAKEMADGNMLPIIVFAVLFGLSIVAAGEHGKPVAKLFGHLNEVLMKLVFIVMLAAPYGVFCLVGRTFADIGWGALLPLLRYFGLVLVMLLVHGLGVYAAMVLLLARLGPLQFFRNAAAVHLFAFSTASSSATLPVTMDAAQTRMGIGRSIASFVLPLGATINMDGTAIMQGVATVFIAQAYRIDIGLSGYLTVILTATLASIGTAGVPGVGLVLLTMVLRQVGLPVEGIALVIGIDRILDMVRTAVNVTGDLVVGTIVARSEGQLDEDVFRATNSPAG